MNSKKLLVNNIYFKLNKSISKKYIHDVVNIISNYISEEICNDRSVSIKNFGTFSPYIFHEHMAYDVCTGMKRFIPAFKSVKFRIHSEFQAILNKRRASMKKRSWKRKKVGQKG